LSAAKRKPTLLKTIRISETLDNLLKKDAASRRMTTNALIQSILTKYSEWDRFADRYGFISMTHDTLRTIIEKTEDQKLIEASKELGTRVPKDILLFWFGKMGVAVFLKYLALLSDYARYADFEIAEDGLKYTVTVHHNLGPKWSIYLKGFLESGLKSTTGLEGETEVSKSSVVITFSVA
jgi:hypothetical protein